MQQNMRKVSRFEGSQVVLVHPSGKKIGWRGGKALGNEHGYEHRSYRSAESSLRLVGILILTLGRLLNGSYRDMM
jgi:hypothetical protein